MLFSSTDAVTQLIHYGANVYTSSGRPESCRNCSSAFFYSQGFFFRLSVLLFTPLKNDKTRESLFS